MKVIKTFSTPPASKTSPQPTATPSNPPPDNYTVPGKGWTQPPTPSPKTR